MMIKIHPIQKSLLRIFKDFPGKVFTIRDLKDKCKVSSTSVIHHHINQLKKKGRLKRDENNKKHYLVISESPQNEIIFLNLYKYKNIGDEEKIIDKLPICKRFLPSIEEDIFLVEYENKESFKKLFFGGYLICKKSDPTENGTLILCAVEGKILIRTFYELGGQKLLISKYSEDPDIKNPKRFTVLAQPIGLISKRVFF